MPGTNDLASLDPALAAELVDKSLAGALTHKSSQRVEWSCRLGHKWLATVSSRTSGDGCPYCSGRRVLQGFNDLWTVRPDIAASLVEPEFGLTVTASSGKKAMWTCEYGHTWQATVDKRSHGRGCPVCAGQTVVQGVNDLATTNPDLAATLVDPVQATAVSWGSSRKKLEWRCPQGHTYWATVASRSKGIGCTYCAGKAVLVGDNDLWTTHPALASELVDPSVGFRVVAGHNGKARWRCSQGHEWESRVIHRALRGVGCPTCAQYGYDINREAWLYLLEHEADDLLQLGITNDPKVRLKAHGTSGWRPIDLRGPMDGVLARNWESSILKFLRSRGIATGRQAGLTKFSGYTESWRRADFPASTTRELMDAVELDEGKPSGQSRQ